MPTLLIDIEGQEVYSEEVDRDCFTVGRSSAATVKIPVKGVSKVHARFTRTEDGYVIEDADSKNGIAINGTRTEKSPIVAGDEIRLGASVTIHWEFVRRKAGEAVDTEAPLDPGEMWPAARRARATGRKIRVKPDEPAGD